MRARDVARLLARRQQALDAIAAQLRLIRTIDDKLHALRQIVAIEALDARVEALRGQFTDRREP